METQRGREENYLSAVSLLFLHSVFSLFANRKKRRNECRYRVYKYRQFQYFFTCTGVATALAWLVNRASSASGKPSGFLFHFVYGFVFYFGLFGKYDGCGMFHFERIVKSGFGI